MTAARIEWDFSTEYQGLVQEVGAPGATWVSLRWVTPRSRPESETRGDRLPVEETVVEETVVEETVVVG